MRDPALSQIDPVRRPPAEDRHHAVGVSPRGARLGAVLIGLVPYALVLGAQATQKGLGVAEVSLMTGLNFAGGSEFAAIQLWTSPPNILLIAAVTLLVNSRYVVMSAALSPFMRHVPKRKALPALAFMSDASWAIGIADAQKRSSAGHPQPFSLPFYMGASLAAEVGIYLSR